jgi:N utilization substance protein B
MLQLMVEMRDHAENYLDVSQKKHLATAIEKNPSRIFIENKVLLLLDSNASLEEIVKKKGLNYWDRIQSI